jgi:hypothetical protein
LVTSERNLSLEGATWGTGGHLPEWTVLGTQKGEPARAVGREDSIREVKEAGKGAEHRNGPAPAAASRGQVAREG